MAHRPGGIQRAFAKSGVIAIISMLLAVVSGILAARLLGPEGRGYLGVIVFWAGFFAVFGRPPMADVMVVEAGGADQRGIDTAFLRRMMKINRIALLLFLPIYLGVIWLFFARYPDEIRLIAVAFAAVQVFCSFQQQVFEGAFRASQAFNLLFLFRLSVPVLYIAALLVSLIFFEPDVLTFALSHMTAMVLSLSFRFLVVRSAVDSGVQHPKKPVSWTELRALLASFYGGAVFTFLALHVDKAMVMLTSTAAEIGIYLVALALALPAQGLIGYALNSIGLPALMKVQQPKRSGAYHRLLRLTLLVSFMQSAIIAIAAPFAIPIVFGADFTAAGPMAAAIALSTVFMPLRRAFAEIFRSERRADMVAKVEGFYLAGFAVTFMVAVYLEAQWPFVPAFLIANLGAVIWLWLKLRRIRPDVRLSAWAIPRISTINELIEIARSAIGGRKKTQ